MLYVLSIQWKTLILMNIGLVVTKLVESKSDTLKSFAISHNQLGFFSKAFNRFIKLYKV